ncbi:LysR substrate-binding domain-containing protein [Ruegeria sp. 2205SS24-7]|uniref:LysR substrate-binding domain-containing protein n=1 Tax=Ruegeria discodermiae TaxID=3064389 RepID=UPI0027409407|nr:LysR substrate-binding domain-containing protein [Ruegeria sp. 2205SS24-7]MDP5219375.1 LysR substrate-binding domain-containing protein [Ruegeria sp. 2205SS24-7]
MRNSTSIPVRYSQLKAFHNVALTGGFSRAAEALNLTQPAISEQVRKLEQDHDVLLFHRERKRVRLTEAGERLFHLTRQFFEVEQQIEEVMSESGAAIEGELRIIADSAHHVTDLLGRFRARYPNVTISLRSGNTADVVTHLRSYAAEIGVVGGLPPGRDMQVIELASTEITAFAALDMVPHKRDLTLADLTQYPLIFREAGSKTRQKLEEQAEARGLHLKPAITAEGREAVREVVASGAGIGFVSRAEYVEDARLRQIPLSDIRAEMSEAIVHLAQRRDVRVIRAFMEVAREVHGPREP